MVPNDEITNGSKWSAWNGESLVMEGPSRQPKVKSR